MRGVREQRARRQLPLLRDAVGDELQARDAVVVGCRDVGPQLGQRWGGGVVGVGGGAGAGRGDG